MRNIGIVISLRNPWSVPTYQMFIKHIAKITNYVQMQMSVFQWAHPKNKKLNVMKFVL